MGKGVTESQFGAPSNPPTQHAPLVAAPADDPAKSHL